MATRWNAEAESRFRLDGGFRLIVILPGQLWGQPVQQHVKAACGRLVGASQGDARLPRKTARSLDLTRRRQRVEAHDEDLDESLPRAARLGHPAVGGRSAVPAHQPPPLRIPRCALASSLIISGVQRGACVSFTSTHSTPLTLNAASRAPSLRSEERREGKEWVRTFRSRWEPDN